MERLEGRSLLSVGLDTSFGTGGVVTGSFASANQTAVADAVAVQPDGKIVVAGTRMDNTFALVVERFNPNGSVDTTFGSGGVSVAYDGNHVLGSLTGIAGQSGVANRVLIQPDGKIIVGGTILTAKNEQAAVFRLNANGSPDASFGAGGSYFDPQGTASTALSLALGADGKIVLIGTTVERLTATGTLDTTFGTGGILPIPAPPPAVGAPNGFLVASVAVQPDGKIVLAGNVSQLLPGGGTTSAAAARLNVNGTLDTSFGSGGFFIGGAGGFSDLTIQAGGKIDLAGAFSTTGQSGSTYIDSVTQLNPDGSRDTSFKGTIASGGSNVITSPPAPSLTDAIAIQPDGKIVTAGNGVGLSVTRLTGAGSTDASLAAKGIEAVPVPIPTGESGLGRASLAIAPGGKIIAVATLSNAGQSGIHTDVYSFVIARLNPGETTGDYLGTGETDPAVYLPGSGSVIVGLTGKPAAFGIPGPGQTLPAPGDYDGSGKTELGVYLPSLAEFAYRPANGGADKLIPFGIPGPGQTIPAPGDYFGTGQTDIAAYLPSLGDFALRNPAGGPDLLIPFGIKGAGQTIPTPGDYDGSGKTELAVYLPILGEFAYRPANGGADRMIPFGTAGAGQTIPMPGDYDGSGKTELAAYIPRTTFFGYRPASGSPDVIFKFGNEGAGQTLPMPGDYDGSGHDELGVYVTDSGLFGYRPANGGPDVISKFGIAGMGQTVPFNQITAANPLAMVSASSLDFPPDPTHKRHPGPST